MALGNRINEIRKEKKISIDELCERSGVPKGTLSKITAGITANPTLDTVQAIARALNCRLDDFDDEPHHPDSSQSVSSDELSFIKKYRALDTYGQNTVLAVLDCEYTRCNESVAVQNTARRIVPLPNALQAAYPNIKGLDYDDDPKTVIKRFAGRDGTFTEWAISEKQAAQLAALMAEADCEDASSSV